MSVLSVRAGLLTALVTSDLQSMTKGLLHTLVLIVGVVRAFGIFLRLTSSDCLGGIAIKETSVTMARCLSDSPRRAMST